MKTFEGIAAAADDVRRFFIRNEDQLPELVQTKVGPFVGTGSSPVDLVATFTKAIYANRDELADGVKAEALEIAAGTAYLVDTEGFHNRFDGRAMGMSYAMRRESGEKAGAGRAWPKKADDPAADADFAKPVEALAPAAPEAPKA